MITTTSYRLPNFDYLRRGRLTATLLYIGLYYSIGLVLLTIFANDEAYRLYGPVVWPFIFFFLLIGINVMWQLVRVAIAVASRWQWYEQATIAQYELDISPIEAAILLRARPPAAIATILIQSLVNKNVIRLVPTGRKIQVLDCYEDEKPLYYFEDYLAGLLLKEGRSSKMSRRQLLHGQHIGLVEQHIYDALKRRGYFAKQSPFQEGLGQYLRVGAYYVMFFLGLLPIVLIAGGPQASPGVADTPFIVPQGDATILVGSIICITLIVPFLVYVRALYTRQGTDKMSLALGFYWYLRTVYKYRLASGYVLSASEERQYGPYLDVFGFRKKPH